MNDDQLRQNLYNELHPGPRVLLLGSLVAELPKTQSAWDAAGLVVTMYPLVTSHTRFTIDGCQPIQLTWEEVRTDAWRRVPVCRHELKFPTRDRLASLRTAMHRGAPSPATYRHYLALTLFEGRNEVLAEYDYLGTRIVETFTANVFMGVESSMLHGAYCDRLRTALAGKWLHLRTLEKS